MVVLDTNIIIDYLLGKENIVKVVDNYPSDDLSMTFVNKYELLKHEHRKELEEAAASLQTYHSTEGAILAASEAYQRMRSIGKMMTDNDLLIFGVCVDNDESLLTQDKAFRFLNDQRIRVIE